MVMASPTLETSWELVCSGPRCCWSTGSCSTVQDQYAWPFVTMLKVKVQLSLCLT